MVYLKMFCYLAWGVAGLSYTAWLITGIINGRKMAKEICKDFDD